MPSKCGAGRRRTQRKGIGPLHKGDLTSRGYSASKSKTARRSALKKVVKAEGPLKAFRQLNAIAVYDKRSAPTKSRTFKADRNWVRRTYMKNGKKLTQRMKGGGMKEDALKVLLDNKLITDYSEDALDRFTFQSKKIQEGVPYELGGYTFVKSRDGSRGWKLTATKDGESVNVQTFTD